MAIQLKPLSFKEYLIQQGLFLQKQAIDRNKFTRNGWPIEELRLEYYLHYLKVIGFEKMKEFIEQEMQKEGFYFNQFSAQGIEITQEFLIEHLIQKFNEN